QRHPVRADRRPRRCLPYRPPRSPGRLHQPLYGEDGRFRQALLSGVPARRGAHLWRRVAVRRRIRRLSLRRRTLPRRQYPQAPHSGNVALGAFSFTMDALPFSPQIQNIIPTTYFKTTNGAAPILGTLGAIFILILGMTYLEWRRRQAARAGEGYGEG